MSDDRLFASNNAIGRKWYFINLIILIFLSFIIHILFRDYIIPNATTETYTIIATWISYFLYLILLITFFSLVERRLYDVAGKRDTISYKQISSFLQIIVVFQVGVIAVQFFPIGEQLPINSLQLIAGFFDAVFLLIVFILCFIKGKISNFTYEEYKRRDKYR